MKKLFVLFLCSSFTIHAQNLILNPSFENGTPAYNTSIVAASWPELVGLWEFNNMGTPLIATVGTALTLTGSHTTIAGYGGPDNAVRIGAGSFYTATNAIGANGGGAFTNRYTLLFDFRINASAIWRTLYQTNVTNSNDGEIFARNADGLIGVAAIGGYSIEGAIVNTWHRLIISVRNGGGGRFDIFLDGRRVNAGTVQALDGRFSLGGTLLLFADDTGDDGLIDVSTVALFNTDLSQAQMESLGRWTCSNWTGTGNYQQIIRNGGYPAAFAGSYYCYAGSDAALNAEQVIDVTALSGPIDAGIGIFTFSGRLQTYTQVPQDQSRIIVEYRNAALTVLGSYDTGNQTTSGVWTAYSNVLAAPVGTRNVRIRLISTKNNGVSNDCYFDDMSLTFTSPLPVELLSFTGSPENNRVKLNWKTASETNCSHFIIERSNDMQNWGEIGKVNGAGNNNTIIDYNSYDDRPWSFNYYRLKQFDFNGDTEIFGPIAVAYELNNPRVFMVNGEINIANTDFDEVELYDLNGKLLLQYPLAKDLFCSHK